MQLKDKVSSLYENAKEKVHNIGEKHSYPCNFTEFIDLFELDDNAEILELIK